MRNRFFTPNMAYPMPQPDDITPADGFGGMNVSEQYIAEVREWLWWNQRLSQSFRFEVNASSIVSEEIDLSANGRELLGVLLTSQVTTGADIVDFTTTFKVNNNVILNKIAANLLSPQFNQSLEDYYPTPQDLKGTDTFEVTFENKGLANTFVYFTVIYLPQL